MPDGLLERPYPAQLCPNHRPQAPADRVGQPPWSGPHHRKIHERL